MSKCCCSDRMKKLLTRKKNEYTIETLLINSLEIHGLCTVLVRKGDKSRP
jgi:hypothetical protein